MSLFGVFDPVSWIGIPFNWVVFILMVVIIPLCYYSEGGSIFEVMGLIVWGVSGMFSDISYPHYMGLILMSMVFFVFISLSNGVGLVPYVFGGTAHLVVTLSLGMILWLSFMLMGWVKNFMNSCAHLVPEGAPFVLAPFMVLIETVSHLIRPVTLSVRLAANMMAGHLIVGLISSMSLIGVWCMVVSVFFQGVLLILEWAVVFIQSFVFSVLIMLYALEYY